MSAGRLARCRAPLTIGRLLESPPTDSNITVNGFIRSVRNQKKLSFASIGDGSSLEPLQAVLTPQQAQRLSTGTAVRITGSWKLSPNAKAQTHELHAATVDILGASDPATFPLQKKYHSSEYLRTIPHLRTRAPFNSLLLRFRSRCIAQLTQFFAEREFTQTHPPIITSSDCEGAGEVFHVDGKERGPVTEESDGTFFRSPKYLTVSSQLHLEALAQSVGNVWTLSPTFRAEKSDTPRHLSEFYMLEAEITFVEDMESVMNLVEDLVRHLTSSLFQTAVGKEIVYGKRGDRDGVSTDMSEILEQRWRGMMSKDWPRITYTDAISLLQRSQEQFEHKPQWGSGLQAEHERFIASAVGKGSPVFVTGYPATLKPFYMLPSPAATSNGRTVECFDLLVPEVCEIAGGSMREHRLEGLLSQMRSSHMIPPGTDLADDELGNLKWYIDLRRWGSVPHGGFGLGFDRLLGYLSGVQSIRDIVTFPRWAGRCDC